MSVISSVMLVQSDPRIAAGLRFGFEREGTRVVVPEPDESIADALDDDCQIVVIGAADRDDGLGILIQIRGALLARSLRIPVLYVGNGVSRQEALSEGATEVLPPPSYVRDVVTLARILCSPIRELTSAITGELGDHFGLFYVIRALSAINRRGVLTLMRGLRRGELRFYDGEVTSAQVGMLHGLAAFHQLLLWSDARFELRPENVVRRQQIPLSPVELFDNSEEFLRDIHEAADGLSPSSVFQQQPGKAQEALERAPEEVRSVMRLFDGSRSIADVIEDSPYRVFETLRIASRLRDFGAIDKVLPNRPKPNARTALAIEEWLTDGDAVPRRSDADGSEPIGPPRGEPASPPRLLVQQDDARTERETDAVPSVSVDWDSLIPEKRTSVDGDAFSPVVPSSSASGEINSGAMRAAAVSAGRSAVEIADAEVGEEPGEPEQTEPPIVPEEIPDLAGQWQGDTGPIPEDLEPVSDVEIPRSQSEQTASGEIAQSATPKYLGDSADVVREKVVVDSEVAAPTELVAAGTAAPAETVTKAAAVEARPPSKRAESRPGRARASSQRKPRAGTPAPTTSETPKRKATQPPIDEKDAFTDDEAAFFDAGANLAGPSDVETFEDLDEGYDVPKSFWQRLLARPDQAPKKKPKSKAKRRDRRPS